MKIVSFSSAAAKAARREFEARGFEAADFDGVAGAAGELGAKIEK